MHTLNFFKIIIENQINCHPEPVEGSVTLRSVFITLRRDGEPQRDNSILYSGEGLRKFSPIALSDCSKGNACLFSDGLLKQ